MRGKRRDGATGKWIPGHPVHRAVLEQAGAVDHFADAELYDRTYADRTDDVAMYVELARAWGGPVLEHGCGTGRITLPIARAGVPVVAVDRSRPLLDALRARLRAEPLPVRVRQADVRTWRPKARFPLVICPFNTLLHLWDREDARRYLAGVRQALAPAGRFVFDASVPRPADLARDPGRWMRAGTVRWQGRRWRTAERFAYEPLEQIRCATSRSAAASPCCGCSPTGNGSRPRSRRCCTPRACASTTCGAGSTGAPPRATPTSSCGS